MTCVPSSRAVATAQIETITSAAEELRKEFERRPLRDDMSVCIEIAGAPMYYISDGRLRFATKRSDCRASVATDPEASSSTSEAKDPRSRELVTRVEELEDELYRRNCDVRIAFGHEAVLAELVDRARDAFEQNDLPRVLSAMLCEVALPSWGGGLRDVEVSGVSSLARLLWSAWLSRESGSVSAEQQHAWEKSKQSWLDEDLSQGWVMVHSVSPGIKDRVAVFQSGLDELRLARPQQSSAGVGDQQPHDNSSLTAVTGSDRSHWMDELVRDLRQAAEQFHDSMAAGGSCAMPPAADHVDVERSVSSDNRPVPTAIVSTISHGYGSCTVATAPAVASASVDAARSTVSGRAAPPKSSGSFL